MTLQGGAAREGLRNVRFGLAALPLGLLLGLGMSLYAFVPMVKPPAGLVSYAELPRRLIRLAHIAAIMLPLLNVVVGGWLDRLALPVGWRRAASWLLLLPAIGLPLALIAEALVPPLAGLHVSGLPALALTAGACVVAAGAVRLSAASASSEPGCDRSSR